MDHTWVWVTPDGRLVSKNTILTQEEKERRDEESWSRVYVDAELAALAEEGEYILGKATSITLTPEEGQIVAVLSAEDGEDDEEDEDEDDDDA